MLTHVARVNFELPDDLHRQAKAAAAIEGVTLKEWIIKAMSAKVDSAQTDRKER